MSREHLKLKNQLCFPIYAASRLITRSYQPYLENIGLTYPQYLVMLVLWEEDNLPVTEITSRLILNTNTVTPLLQRLEKQGLITREKSDNDIRKVIINLTEKGRVLAEEAESIPVKLGTEIASSGFTINELLQLKTDIYKIIDTLSVKNQEK